MEIESYLNGELVSIESLENVPPILPNLTGFIIQMMSSNGYNQLIQTNSNQLATSRLEIAIVRLELKSDVTTEDLTLFKFLWDSVIDGRTISLNNSDSIEWNQIAQSNNIPFGFDENFKIKLNEN